VGLKDTVKDGVEIIGLIPTVLGFFDKTPPSFAPSPAQEPQIEYVAGIMSALTFAATWIWFMKVIGPPAEWTRRDRIRHFWLAIAGIAAFFASAVSYLMLVRYHPGAGAVADIAQYVTWPGMFMTLTFTLTTLACFLKRP
jgi:hypothetical protein